MLSHEFPRLREYCTLSPIPGFATWLGALLKSPESAGPKALVPIVRPVIAAIGTDTAKIAADPECMQRLAPVREPLMRLCATYLLNRDSAGAATLDPVARFHLNNGARLERLNWSADTSRKGLRESLGLMVNYLYEPRAIEGNHDKFVHGVVVASRRVRELAVAI